MNPANDGTRLVDDLAARWTDAALEILASSGIDGVSVPMELETWHALQDVMQLVVRRQQSLPLAPMRVDVFMKQVLLAAMLRVARKFAPGFNAFALDLRLRPWIRRRKVHPAEHRLYLLIIRSATANRRAPPLNRSGRVPRLAAVGG